MILPTAYFAPLYQYALMAQAGQYQLEIQEHFVKQSYRNRCEIFGANGVLKLIVPVKKYANHTPIREIEIRYAENWQKQHWKSLESAYRTSPFFEFFEDDLIEFFNQQKYTSLIDYNAAIEKLLFEFIGLNIDVKPTETFEIEEPNFREIIHPKNQTKMQSFDYPEYVQVFSDRFNFKANLSILDVLFNLGPQTKNYILNLPINLNHGQKN